MGLCRGLLLLQRGEIGLIQNARKLWLPGMRFPGFLVRRPPAENIHAVAQVLGWLLSFGTWLLRPELYMCFREKKPEW